MKRKIMELDCYDKDISEEFTILTKSLEVVEDQTTSAKGNLTYFQSVILNLQAFLFEVANMVKDAIDCEVTVINLFIHNTIYS